MGTAALTGRATIFGFIGDVSFTGVGTLIKEGGDFNDDWKLDELTDELNDAITKLGSNRKFKAKLQFTPVAASGTNTLANAATSLEPPAMLAAVTLANFKWATANTLKWYYSGGWKLAFKKDGLATYELEIECHSVNDLSVNRTVIS